MKVLIVGLLVLLPSLAHAECTATVATKPGTYTNGDGKVTLRVPKACGSLTKGDALTVTALHVITVPPGTGTLTSALTQAITAAQSGPVTLLLKAGTYTGNLILPRTSASYGITITGPTLPPGRVTAAAEGTLPRLVPSDLGSPTITVQGDGYTLRGLQIETPGVGVTTVDLDASTLPKNVTVDQVLIRGNATTGGHRGIGLNGITATVTNSWIDRMWEVGRDSQAIAAWDTPGPLRIENTYLEASGENFLLGGAEPTCGCVPTDVVFTRNTVAKDPAWRAMAEQPQVKNLFEVKYGRRITVTGNTFERNWLQAQTGWSILITAKGVAPANYIEDVTFTDNVIRDVSSGLNVAAVDGPVRRVTVSHNLWDRIDADAWGGDGRWAMVLTGTAGVEDLTLAHNTVLGLTGNQFLGLYGDVPVQRFVMTHTIVEHRDYGIHASAGLADAALMAMAPAAVFRDNAILGPAAYWLTWPEGNFVLDLPLPDQFDGETLKTSSPLATLSTSDGTTVGR